MVSGDGLWEVIKVEWGHQGSLGGVDVLIGEGATAEHCLSGHRQKGLEDTARRRPCTSQEESSQQKPNLPAL